MRTAVVAILISLLALPVCEGKRHSTLRVHTEANENDGAVFATKIRTQSGRDRFIQKIPAISENDVIGFAVYPAADGTRGVLLELNDHGRLALDTLSIERRGTWLFIFVNGRPITELQIDRRVSDGRIYIASGLTSTDIALMRKDWPLLPQRKK
ncbi:MAG: hypothetical protein QOH88_3321 [Verrucomicrobiota bacterium]|jgi:hypothetical protein